MPLVLVLVLRPPHLGQVFPKGQEGVPPRRMPLPYALDLSYYLLGDRARAL